MYLKNRIITRFLKSRIFKQLVGSVRPLLVPEILVKSNGTYRAAQCLRNPGPSCRYKTSLAKYS